MRKTFNVQDFKDHINRQLTTDDYFNRDHRQGLLNTLETVLHQTGNYHGFRYLTKEEIPVNQLPGIYWINNNPVFDNTDPTRVHYY